MIYLSLFCFVLICIVLYGILWIKDLIEEKELFIAITTDKFIYSKEISELKTGTKRNKGQNFAEIKKGKIIENSFIINNKTKLMCLSKKGIAYILDGYKLNVNNIHINNLIGNLPSDDFIISFLTIDNINEGYLLTVNNKSFFKKTNITEYFSSNRTNGIIALKLDDDEELIEAAYVPNEDYTILLGTDKGYVSKFSLNNIVEAGRVAKGRPLIRFKEQNENVVSLNIVNNIELDKSSLLLLTKNGIGKLTLINELLDKKTEKGMSSAFKAITLKKDDYLLKNKIVVENDIIIVNTNLGKTIKIEANNVNSYSRNAKGDKLITLNDNDYVNSLNIIQE
jgi:DNA gyrase subunit A